MANSVVNHTKGRKPHPSFTPKQRGLERFWVEQGAVLGESAGAQNAEGTATRSPYKPHPVYLSHVAGPDLGPFRIFSGS